MSGYLGMLAFAAFIALIVAAGYFATRRARPEMRHGR
jgi:hypothetical protein